MTLPPQIIRLVVLTLLIVAGYLLMRGALMPATFGDYGWYRAAALGEIAAQEVHYVGRTTCAECHGEEAELHSQHGHQDVSCAACHGPGYEHALDPEREIRQGTEADCRRCHEADLSRPVWFKQVRPADHYPEWTCIECHLPHFPSEIR